MSGLQHKATVHPSGKDLAIRSVRQLVKVYLSQEAEGQIPFFFLAYVEFQTQDGATTFRRIFLPQLDISRNIMDPQTHRGVFPR